MKPLALLAALAATPAAAADLSFGALYGTGHFLTEPQGVKNSLTAYGGYARVIWHVQDSDLRLGAEVSHRSVSGTVLRKETAKTITDVSAIIGYDMGRWMPFVTGGYSHARTTMHGSDGYHVGAGVTVYFAEHWEVSLVVKRREYDGPAQGADLLANSAEVSFGFRF